MHVPLLPKYPLLTESTPAALLGWKEETGTCKMVQHQQVGCMTAWRDAAGREH